jgi:hypothetical protein
LGPFAHSEGSNDFSASDEIVPGLAGGVDDVVLIAVTHGRKRSIGIYAVLKAGLPTTLVTDSEVALELLALAERQ